MTRPRFSSPLLATALLIGAPAAVSAQIANGALATQHGGHNVILDSRVAQLIRSNLPECNKKLLVFTQCYGGNFINKFQSDLTIAVASATSEGEKANYNTYDIGAAFGLRPGTGRTGQLMHDEAIDVAQQNAAGAGIALLGSPAIGGGMPLANFPLQSVSMAAQQFVHILFYAAQPEQPDLNAYGIIYEFYPHADIVVVSSGLMQPWTNYAADEYGLDFALEAIGQRMSSCSHLFIMFVGDHGHQIWDVGTAQEIFQNIEIPTPALPTSVGEDLNGTPEPMPAVVIFLPYPPNSPPFATPPGGPAPFEPNQWTISVPLSGGGQYVAVASRQSYQDGGNGTVGDAVEEGVRLEFDMTAAAFIDAFVGHTNTIVVTNSTGLARTIRLSLDPGPMPMVPLPEPCCYANCDCSTVSPTLNVADFTCFLQRYAAGEIQANCDGSTIEPVLNVGDFTCFLQAFATGCP
jgi:hypothetical protein